MNPSLHRCTRLLTVCMLAWLAACGGGGGGDPAAPAAPAAAVAADPGAASASTTPAGATAVAAGDLVASDQAQPSDEDPPALDAAGNELKATVAAAPVVDDPARVAIGDLLFHDPLLSASGRIACGTCHLQDFGHADAPGTRLPKGGAALDKRGARSSMTVRYLNEAPPFRLSRRGTPSGGFLWDGRADSRFEQVFHDGPFFNPVEMAIPGSAADPSALAAKVRAAPYWNDLKALYAAEPQRIATDAALFVEVAKLIEIYQRGDPDYNAFDSKFDQVQAGSATFTEAEQRGWALFSDPRRGNCTACHTASLNRKSLFTGFGYAALGVPRNHEVPANADPAFFDLGVCNRQRAAGQPSDTAVRKPRYCGLFKTPTLRNVERTAPYFHNAAVATLEEAVRFHFERDTRPERWYRKADGTTDRSYNDLPPQYRGNLATGRPFDGGFRPSDRDIADLLAFLRTLNDADQTTPLN